MKVKARILIEVDVTIPDELTALTFLVGKRPEDMTRQILEEGMGDVVKVYDEQENLELKQFVIQTEGVYK